MKNLFIAIIIFFSFSLYLNAQSINECKTDIYYGNGVWNEYEDAEKSRRALEKRILDREIIKGDSFLQVKYGKVKLAYNWGQGTLLDVLETYYQLREAGQLEGVGFFTAIAILTAYQPELILGAIATQTLMEPFTKDWEQGNVDEMWQKYYRESFKLGHRVLLVSHSQGNLFANRIFDTINPTEYKKYFANVQVASPASQVKADEVGKGAYVTLFGDPIINPIPGSMPGNANGSPGHAFVEAYLAQQDPFDKIVSRIKAALPTLDVELTQWDTEGEPSNKGTCEEKVKVKHRFDLAVDMPFDVYPFNLSKKLYQVNGEWVKASCGGTHILDQWDGKKDNECWMIDNVEKEKINQILKIYTYTVPAYWSGTGKTTYLDGMDGTGTFFTEVKIGNRYNIVSTSENVYTCEAVSSLAGIAISSAKNEFEKMLPQYIQDISNDPNITLVNYTLQDTGLWNYTSQNKCPYGGFIEDGRHNNLKLELQFNNNDVSYFDRYIN